MVTVGHKIDKAPKKQPKRKQRSGKEETETQLIKQYFNKCKMRKQKCKMRQKLGKIEIKNTQGNDGEWGNQEADYKTWCEEKASKYTSDNQQYSEEEEEQQTILKASINTETNHMQDNIT